MLAFAGCGGDDSEPNGSKSAETAARAAVADFLAAAGDSDARAACATLTDRAQDQVEQGGTGQLSGDCFGTLEALLDTAKTDAFATLTGAAEQIRSGDLKGDGEVTVAIAENDGKVSITADGELLSIPVQEVSGAWLIADARGLLFGTGGAPDGSATGTSTTRDRAVELLSAWEGELVPVLLLLRKRQELYLSDRLAESIEVGRRAKRGLLPVQAYGRDARTPFIDSESTPLAEATIAAGDAWTEWAFHARQLLPGGGNFGHGQRLADLAAAAVRSQREAYRLAHEPIPPSFRVG